MRDRPGSRWFWVVLATTAGIRLTVGLLTCCALMAAIWVIARGSLDTISVFAVAGTGVLGVGTAWGIVRQAHHLWRVIAASRRLSRDLAAHRVPVPQRLRALAGGYRVDAVDLPGLGAITAGLFRPRIVVDVDLADRLDDDALAAVLEHEREHHRGRDPLRFLLVDTSARRLPLLPLLSTWTTTLRTDRELAADRAAEHVVGRAPLARALLTGLTHTTRPSAPAPAAALCGSDLDLRVRRLEGAADIRASGRPSLRLGLLSAAGVAVVAWGLWGSSVLLATVPMMGGQ